MPSNSWDSYTHATYSPAGMPAAHQLGVGTLFWFVRGVAAETATKNMDEAAFTQVPAAGHLLSFPSPVAGVAPARAKLG